MKKLFYILLALLVVATLLLAGCSSSNQGPTSSNEASIPSSESDPNGTPDKPEDPTPPPTEDPVVPDTKPAMSTDPADYWVSDTEFDIIGYCEAHGLLNPKVGKHSTDDTIHFRRMGDVNGKQKAVLDVDLGVRWFEVWYYDWDNRVATLFAGSVVEGVPVGSERVSYAGTDVWQYRLMIDFIIYVIPRLNDNTIDDPMLGFGKHHTIHTCELKLVDGKWEFGTLGAPTYVTE